MEVQLQLVVPQFKLEDKMKDNIDFLGKGWSFPVKFNKTLNVLETTTGNKRYCF